MPSNELLSGKKCYWPIRTLTLRSKYTLMRAKHKSVHDHIPKQENQLYSIPEKWRGSAQQNYTTTEKKLLSIIAATM